MNAGNLFQGIGLFICIGGILLVVLIAFAASRLFGNRNKEQVNRGTIDRNDPQTWQQRGPERPEYDSPDIESSGGFGRPSGGMRAPSPRRTRGVFGSTTGEARSSRPLHNRGSQSGSPRDQEDDDNIRSSGGFGGG